MVKFTASMDVNSVIECNEFNSNCKIAATLAHDVECIYLFKLLLSCSVTCLATISGPIVTPLPPSLLGWGYKFPKLGKKGRDAKHSLKLGVCQKGGKITKGCGKCLKCKGKKSCKSFVKMLCKSKNKRKIHYFKKIQTISTFTKFWKDSTSLNLLGNITKGAMFSWTIKC